MLRNGPYIPSFLSVFIITWYWNLSNAFCASTEMIMCFFLCSINMVYFINWFSCVEHWLYAGGKSHLVMVYNPLMYCWIQYANISLNTCISVFVRHICAILTFFFFLISLSGFGIRVILVSKSESEVLTLLLFFGRVWEVIVLILL